ncbi:D-alanyl-D-alanine carboxypeptidase [Candidatus Hydrogenisulfobacillus filiaventi]|uniref:D-alanyl-D-alanine carboxypeptidase n=1 Tax=Candidatus Hydrogenisulfobacillus filiaventi TaxID=2707344 RepID=A0A6F8ZEA3_9FIRM|nr:D-alanyl-D-alanine carboxypeptidase [Candidatus Hydrogenisulfobacillus filiaventi]
MADRTRRRRRRARRRRLRARWGMLAGMAAWGALLAAAPRPGRPQLTVPARMAGLAPEQAPRFHTAARGAELAVLGGPVLFRLRARAPRPIASVTKVMTAYLTLRHLGHGLGRRDRVALAAADVEDYDQGLPHDDSEVAMHPGEQVTVADLLWALMLPSADDAAWALARVDAGSARAFVAEMNATARRLGLRATRYADPDGVRPGSRSDPADLVRLVEDAWRLPAFRELAGVARHRAGPFGTLTNLNRLLGQDGVVGVKTGWTPAAGSCLAFVGERHGLTLVGVVLGEPHFRGMFRDVAGLLNTGYRLPRRLVVRAGERVARLPLPGPGGASVPLVAAHSLQLVLTAPWLSLRVESLAVRLPLRAGTPAAELVVSQPGWPARRVPLLAAWGYRPPWWLWPARWWGA